MAKLEVEVAANIGPFQRSLHNATEGIREFASKAAETGKEIEKGFLGKDLSTLLGIGGAAFALGELANKLKDFAKECVEEFAKMETMGLRLGLTFKDLKVGKEMAEEASATAGERGTAEQIGSAEQSLKIGGVTPGDQMTDAMKILGDLHVENAKGVDEMADAIRAYTVKGGGGKGMGKIVEAIPQLEAKINEQIAAAADAFLQSLGHDKGYFEKLSINQATGEQSMVGAHTNDPNYAEYMRQKNLTPEQFGQEHIKSLPTLLTELKGASTPGAEDLGKKTLEGAALELAARFNQLKESIGEAFKPALMTVMAEFTDNLPVITDDFKRLATASESLLPLFESLAETIHGILGGGAANPDDQIKAYQAGKMDSQGNVIAGGYSPTLSGMSSFVSDYVTNAVRTSLGVGHPSFEAYASTKDISTRNPWGEDAHLITAPIVAAIDAQTKELSPAHNYGLSQGDVQ